MLLCTSILCQYNTYIWWTSNYINFDFKFLKTFHTSSMHVSNCSLLREFIYTSTYMRSCSGKYFHVNINCLKEIRMNQKQFPQEWEKRKQKCWIYVLSDKCTNIILNEFIYITVNNQRIMHTHANKYTKYHVYL